MVFQRTTASVFELVKELPIIREQDIAHLLLTYEEQQCAGKEPDRLLLEQAKQLLVQRLAEELVDFELAHLAQVLYCTLAEYQAEIAVLRRYLETCPDPNSRAWAWWHIIDCLALDGCSQEVVQEQPAFLAWALATFPAEECFFVIADGTQARAWLYAGVGHQWLQQCQQLFQQARWTAENRLDRFYCLRTFVRLALDLRAFEQAQAETRHLQDLLCEDTCWPERWWVAVEVSMLEMVAAHMRDDLAHMRTVAEDITKQLIAWEDEHVHNGDGEAEMVQRLRSLAHNAAAPLYRAKQYDVAIPLFEKAVAYHTIPYQSYLWLAASLWATTRDEMRVVPLLRQAAARFDGAGDPWNAFQRLAEFADAPFWRTLVETSAGELVARHPEIV